jgi:hypothetical protein
MHKRGKSLLSSFIPRLYAETANEGYLCALLSHGAAVLRGLLSMPALACVIRGPRCAFSKADSSARQRAEPRVLCMLPAWRLGAGADVLHDSRSSGTSDSQLLLGFLGAVNAG